jgi:excisionase family DNA binding protein
VRPISGQKDIEGGDGMVKKKKKKPESKTAHEQRKARMRAYYHKNKDQWRKYNRDARTRMTKAEREAYRLRQKEYSRKQYLKNRDKVLKRSTRYQKRYAEWFAAYRAEWYQHNKKKVATSRRRHYHAVVKPRNKAAKAASEFVTLREAVTLLGAKLRPFRDWVYQGRIAAVRTPGGRYLFRRDELEHIRATCHHYPREIRDRLGLTPKGVCK